MNNMWGFSLCRSSHQRCSVRKGVLRNFAKFTGTHLFQSLFFNKIAWHRCFPVNSTKFLRTPFLQNTSRRLLLLMYWTRHKRQKVNSFFWICCFSSKLSYHSYQQRVCKILFLIRTFIKTNSNLICSSF